MNESEGNVKAYEMQTLLNFMKLLPDEALTMVADARFMVEPRDMTDKIILQFAAGEREWRQECKS
jgi:hypothetical protein